ncbi:hypothetical protein HK102_007881, partial [Quaeritorhiza haematococci]
GKLKQKKKENEVEEGKRANWISNSINSDLRNQTAETTTTDEDKDNYHDADEPMEECSVSSLLNPLETMDTSYIPSTNRKRNRTLSTNLHTPLAFLIRIRTPTPLIILTILTITITPITNTTPQALDETEASPPPDLVDSEQEAVPPSGVEGSDAE